MLQAYLSGRFRHRSRSLIRRPRIPTNSKIKPEEVQTSTCLPRWLVFAVCCCCGCLNVALFRHQSVLWWYAPSAFPWVHHWRSRERFRRSCRLSSNQNPVHGSQNLHTCSRDSGRRTVIGQMPVNWRKWLHKGFLSFVAMERDVSFNSVRHFPMILSSPEVEECGSSRWLVYWLSLRAQSAFILDNLAIINQPVNSAWFWCQFKNQNLIWNQVTQHEGPTWPLLRW